MAVPTTDEILALVHRLAAVGRILDLWPPGRRADHVELRMQQRSVRPRDLRHALAHATHCEAAGDGRWKVRGPDLDGDELAIIVQFDGTSFIIVITLYEGESPA